MTAVRIAVTAEHIAAAGLVPSAPQGEPDWHFPQLVGMVHEALAR